MGGLSFPRAVVDILEDSHIRRNNQIVVDFMAEEMILFLSTCMVFTANHKSNNKCETTILFYFILIRGEHVSSCPVLHCIASIL